MSFAIRPVRTEDCETVCHLIHELARYEHLEDECFADVNALREAFFGERGFARALIAWEKNDVTGQEKAVGFALYYFNFSTFLTKRGLYLEDLFIVPEARRRGYGREMMRYLAETAIREGCGRFDWSVLDWNQPAIDFYESLGADVLPDWRICRIEGERLKKAAGRSV